MNLRRIHAHIRVHRPGMHHIQFSDGGDQLLPQVLIQLLQMLHGFHDGVLVADL